MRETDRRTDGQTHRHTDAERLLERWGKSMSVRVVADLQGQGKVRVSWHLCLIPLLQDTILAELQEIRSLLSGTAHSTAPSARDSASQPQASAASFQFGGGRKAKGRRSARGGEAPTRVEIAWRRLSLSAGMRAHASDSGTVEGENAAEGPVAGCKAMGSEDKGVETLGQASSSDGTHQLPSTIGLATLSSVVDSYLSPDPLSNASAVAPVDNTARQQQQRSLAVVTADFTLLSDNAVQQSLPLSTTDAMPGAKLEMLAAAPSAAAIAAADPCKPAAPNTASAPGMLTSASKAETKETAGFGGDTTISSVPVAGYPVDVDASFPANSSSQQLGSNVCPELHSHEVLKSVHILSVAREQPSSVFVDNASEPGVALGRPDQIQLTSSWAAQPANMEDDIAAMPQMDTLKTAGGACGNLVSAFVIHREGGDVGDGGGGGGSSQGTDRSKEDSFCSSMDSRRA